MSDPLNRPVVEDQDDPTAVTTVVVGAISVILLLVIILALEALYHRTLDGEQLRKSAETGEYELRQARTEQLQRISEYRIVDAETGKVTIPVERAMELLIEEDRAGAASRSAAGR